MRLSSMDQEILRVLPCDGLGKLTLIVEACHRYYVRERLERMQRLGLVKMIRPPIFPGRGNKILIQKRREHV
jgi:hypothetical protein